MKTEADKLNLNKLVNIPTGMINSKTKVDDLNVGKLNTVPTDLTKLSDVVSKEAVKNTKFNTLKTKVHNLEKKILEVATVIHKN